MTSPDLWRLDAAAVVVLWRRETGRALREAAAPALQVSVVAAAFAWLALVPGPALLSSPPATAGEALAFFFPGLVVTVAVLAVGPLAAAAAADRRRGLVLAALSGPASRPAVVAGVCAGGATVILAQVGLVTLHAPVCGLRVEAVDAPLALGVLAALAWGCAAFAQALGGSVGRPDVRRAIVLVAAVGMVLTSGALFPVGRSPAALRAVAEWNPLAHALSAMRFALNGHAPQDATVLSVEPLVQLGVVGAYAAAASVWALWVDRRR